MRHSDSLARLVGVLLALASWDGHAQRADCPVHAAFAGMVHSAAARPPADDVASELVDPAKTLLSEWHFEGYVRDSPRHKVPRVFTRQGSVLVFEQWNMAADGASIVSTPPPDLQIGKSPATWGGMRTPSGCVSYALTWREAGTKYSLQIAGPLPAEQQREVLVSLARSIERSARGRQ